MQASKLKRVSVPATGSALPNSRVGQGGPVILLYLSRPTRSNVLDQAMIAGIPNTPAMTDVDWLGRMNWPNGSRSKRY